MKESYWGYWIVLLGVFIVVVMLFTQNATTTNTQDYYQLKEVANSALYDAIDYSYYAKTQQIRIMKEVFVENFIRRFAETVRTTDTYDISFYDLYESPPKVSVRIATNTGDYIVAGDDSNLGIVNTIDLIVEFGNSNAGDTTGCDYYNS